MRRSARSPPPPAGRPLAFLVVVWRPPRSVRRPAWQGEILRRRSSSTNLSEAARPIWRRRRHRCRCCRHRRRLHHQWATKGPERRPAARCGLQHSAGGATNAIGRTHEHRRRANESSLEGKTKTNLAEIDELVWSACWSNGALRGRLSSIVVDLSSAPASETDRAAAWRRHKSATHLGGLAAGHC
jgi:hypothetical protein